MKRFIRINSVDDRPLPPQGKQILDKLVQLSDETEFQDNWVSYDKLVDAVQADIDADVIPSVQDATSLVGYYRTKFLDRNYIEVMVVKDEKKATEAKAKLTDEEKAARRKEKKNAKKAKAGKSVAEEAFNQATA